RSMAANGTMPARAALSWIRGTMTRSEAPQCVPTSTATPRAHRSATGRRPFGGKREITIIFARGAVTVTHARYAAGEPVAGPHIHRGRTDAFYVLEGQRRSQPLQAGHLARRHAAPRATQAFAETTNGGSGSLSLQSSRNAVRRSGSRPATYAPDGATPSVNGSHQSSNVACSTSTATALSTMSRIPAARKRSARWP